METALRSKSRPSACRYGRTMDRISADATTGIRANSVRSLRALCGISLFGTVLVVTARQWHKVSETVAEIGAGAIATALVLALLGLGASVLTWQRSLQELGARTSMPVAMKIYLVGQLGKYIPGTVWALVVQMEIARAAAVRRTEAFGAGLVSVGINIVTGTTLGLAVLPILDGGSPVRYAVAILGAIGCAVMLAPPVLTRLVDVGLKVSRNEPLRRRPSWSGILAAAGLSTVNWLLYGLALAVIAIAAGADPSRTLLLALPAVGLAMTIGLFVVIAPSGIGVREAVLVAALSPVLDASAALGVAVVLRLVFTLADLIGAAATVPIKLSGYQASRG